MRWTLVLLVAILPGASASHVADLDREAPFACPGRDCIPSIDDPQFDDGGWLRDDDRVIGIVGRNETRAYPVGILNWHEIANDELDGVPIAVTYCPLCGTAIVFVRELDDRELSFGVSGRLYRNDLVMYDRETESLWSQVLGEAIWGELHGRHLQLHASTTTTWGEWRDAHPETRALARPSAYPASTYTRYPYGDYEDSTRTLQPVGHEDTRLHPKAWVFGVDTPGGPAAFVQDELKAIGEAEILLPGGRLVATWSPDGPLALWHTEDGAVTAIVGIQSFWFAWADFHPDTTLWPASEPGSAPAPTTTRGIAWSGVLLALAALAAVAFALRERRAP